VVKYDLTSLYDEMVQPESFPTNPNASRLREMLGGAKHERQVDKFDKVVESVVHDLRSLGFEVSEDDCELTIKLKES